MDARPIGVFDSGVGGISVLRDMARMMPSEQFIFYGDNLNAPYGVRAEEEILALSSAVADRLVGMGVKALVIACNTATSAAAEALRKRLAIPVVGMEPALKPAFFRHSDGKILVLATPATLRQQKFHALMELYGKDAVMVPCPGLMEFVERLELSSPALDQYLRERFLPYQALRVEAAVLGCTHYVFLRESIARALPGAALFDGNEGTARRLQALIQQADLENQPGEGRVQFFTSGDERVFLRRMRALYEAE